ncbi:MAG: NYN domain-containing protein [Thermoleophilia bacterium]
MASARVIVFLDYQNVYNGAREAFDLRGDPSRYGQIDALKLAELIVARHPEDSHVAGVRLYRGRPDSAKQPRAYGANMRQSDALEKRGQGLVRVITRTLRYPYDWPKNSAQEKGIDVALAVDFVTMAVSGEYDIGVLMSTDTDLVPALEAVFRIDDRPYPRCEVAAWSRPGAYSRRLQVPGKRLWCHWLKPDDYAVVEDLTDYNLPSS